MNTAKVHLISLVNYTKSQYTHSSYDSYVGGGISEKQRDSSARMIISLHYETWIPDDGGAQAMLESCKI